MGFNELLTKIGNIIKAKVLKYELIIILIILLALALKLLKVPNSGLIITAALTTISIIYFFSAFATSGKIEMTAYDRFVQKLVAFASAVSLIGILLKVQKWPDNYSMITVGPITLILAFIYFMIQKNKNPESEIFDKFLIIRIFILALISGSLLYFRIS